MAQEEDRKLPVTVSKGETFRKRRVDCWVFQRRFSSRFAAQEKLQQDNSTEKRTVLEVEFRQFSVECGLLALQKNRWHTFGCCSQH